MTQQGDSRAQEEAGASCPDAGRGTPPLHTVRWLGVLSDTHGDAATTRRAVEAFQARAVQLLVHCGDIGSPEIPPLLCGWPSHFVLGNVDWNSARLQAAIAAQDGQVLHGRCGTLTVGKRRLAWLHGDDDDRLRELVQSSDQGDRTIS